METISLTRDAADLGVDAALVVTPFYFKPSAGELFEHYSKIINAVDVPIILYSVPKFTGYEIDIYTVTRLVDEFSQVVGIKDSGGSIGRITELIRAVGDRIDVFAGTGDMVLPALLMGASGAIVAVANVAPELCSQLYESFKKGNIEAGREIQMKLTHLNEVLVKRFNQLSAIKEALKILGLNAGYPRSPMLPLKRNERKEVERTLRTLGLLR